MSNLRSGLRHLLDKQAPGLARRYREVRDRRHVYGPPLETPWGFTLRGDEGLAQSREEGHEADVFLALAKSADHIIDVGANVGLFTLLGHHAGVPVTAIEPNRANAAMLLENLQRNGARVEVLPVALAEQTDVLELFGGGQGASLKSQWADVGSTYADLVPVCTLDDLFAVRFAGKRLLIKLDVEGVELNVLRGAQQLFDTSETSWIVEIGLKENFNGEVNPDFVAIFDEFFSRGFDCRAVEADQPVTRAEVVAWAQTGERPWWNINYVFEKA